MKKLTLLVIAISAMTFSLTHAREIQKQDASTVAQSFLESHSQGFNISFIENFSDAEGQLAWIANLEPDGFILVSCKEFLRPILAYSFESRWMTGAEDEQTFLTLIKSYLRCKINFPDPSIAYQQKCTSEWYRYLNAAFEDYRFEQWPPEGTTPTGGWLFTNWTQSAPYNSMCPIDPNTHLRSYAGCPATAMSQILNSIVSINSTRFDESDDYYHNFGAGNQYWIDDDWEEHGFPCFDTLNAYLDIVEENYITNKPLSSDEIAALTFACGTALKQVYSSSISGTFGIEQARDAFQRFGFADSRLVYSSDTMLNYDLAQNIMLGNPAQLGLIDPPHTVGHNVVVDGYNTDEFFHFNFGWGGNSNGWYTMPPTTAPYNLTVIEGIVMDIRGNNPHVSVNELSSGNERINVYFSKEDQLTVENISQKAIAPMINVYDGFGKVLVSSKINFNGTSEKIQILIPPSYQGLLVVKAVYNKKHSEDFKLIKFR
jgi:hypothetical protein